MSIFGLLGCLLDLRVVLSADSRGPRLSIRLCWALMVCAKLWETTLVPALNLKAPQAFCVLT
eukprot:6573581-Prymnesium_polylepis.1